MAESDNAVEILKDIRDEIRGARNELRDEIRGVRTERVEAPARKRRAVLIAAVAVATAVVVWVLILHDGGKKTVGEQVAVETTLRSAPSMAGSSLPDPPIPASPPPAVPPPAVPSAPAVTPAPTMAAPATPAPSMAARPGAAAVAKRTLARHRMLIAPRAELEEPAKL